MSWLKLDDRILKHPKFVRAARDAGSTAVHLWIGMLSYAKEHLSDGRVPVDMIRCIDGPRQRWRARALEALVDAGLVERDGEVLVLHDYLDWNPSKEVVEQKAKEKNARRRPAPAKVSEQGERRGSVQVAHGQRRGSVQVAKATLNDSEALSPVGRASETETETETISDPPPIPPAAPQLTLVAPAARSASTSEAAKGKRSKNPRTRSLCPTDFAPDATTRQCSDGLGFGERAERETRQEFIDWWRGVGLLRADWQATYRNRLRTVAKRLGLKPRKRDAQWAWYQEQLRKAESPGAVVPPPKGFEDNVRSLFGGGRNG